MAATVYCISSVLFCGGRGGLFHFRAPFLYDRHIFQVRTCVQVATPLVYFENSKLISFC